MKNLIFILIVLCFFGCEKLDKINNGWEDEEVAKEILNKDSCSMLIISGDITDTLYYEKNEMLRYDEFDKSWLRVDNLDLNFFKLKMLKDDVCNLDLNFNSFYEDFSCCLNYLQGEHTQIRFEKGHCSVNITEYDYYAKGTITGELTEALQSIVDGKIVNDTINISFNLEFIATVENL